MPDWIETALDDEGPWEDGTVQRPVNTWAEAKAIVEQRALEEDELKEPTHTTNE